MVYEKPCVMSLKVDISRTDVLAGCQGWKDSPAVAEAVPDVFSIKTNVTTNTGDSRYQVVGSTVRREIEGHQILVPLGASLLLLNDTAADVWDLLAEGSSLHSVYTALGEKYITQDSDCILVDVALTASKFEQLGLLEKVI